MNRCKKQLIGFLLTVSMLLNSFYYYTPTVEAKETKEPENTIIQEEEIKEVEIIIVTTESIKTEEPAEPETIDEPVEENIEDPASLTTSHTYTNYLTKSGGIYWNPYTGLKETWYSQRVLPGGGLDIPGRHVNEEGFVCDADGYICVASSTYAKGTVVETSRGIGKVYDCGCAPGTIDIYTDW